MAWNKLGTTTLSSAGDDITISNITSNEFNQFLMHTIESVRTTMLVRVGNGSLDSGSNYARRYSGNGTADGSQTPASRFHAGRPPPNRSTERPAGPPLPPAQHATPAAVRFHRSGDTARVDSSLGDQDDHVRRRSRPAPSQEMPGAFFSRLLPLASTSPASWHPS